MKYSELPNHLPSIQNFTANFNTLLDRFSTSASAQEQIDCIREISQARDAFDTEMAVAGINYARDTSNAAYQEAKDFYDQHAPTYFNLVKQLLTVLC